MLTNELLPTISLSMYGCYCELITYWYISVDAPWTPRYAIILLLSRLFPRPAFVYHSCTFVRFGSSGLVLVVAVGGLASRYQSRGSFYLELYHTNIMFPGNNQQIVAVNDEIVSILSFNNIDNVLAFTCLWRCDLLATVWGQPEHSNIALNCRSAGLSSDPAHEAWFIKKFISLAHVIPNTVWPYNCRILA